MPRAPRHKSVPHPTNDALPDALLMPALYKQAGPAQGFSQLCFNSHRLAPGEVLQVQRRPRQNLEAPLQHAAGGTEARLVLIEAIRGTVVAHSHIDAMRVGAAVTVIQ